MWKDNQFRAAILAAPGLWSVFLLTDQNRPEYFWPLYNPGLFVLLAVISPVLEETVFRGLLQEQLQTVLRPKNLGPISLANLITSLLFTGLHFFYHSPLWAFSVMGPSLLLGYFKERYQNLKGPILLHIFYNAGYYWLFSVP